MWFFTASGGLVQPGRSCCSNFPGAAFHPDNGIRSRGIDEDQFGRMCRRLQSPDSFHPAGREYRPEHPQPFQRAQERWRWQAGQTECEEIHIIPGIAVMRAIVAAADGVNPVSPVVDQNWREEQITFRIIRGIGKQLPIANPVGAAKSSLSILICTLKPRMSSTCFTFTE